MRGLRSFVALLVVLLALGGYLYFVESKRTPGDDAEKKDKVFAVEAEKIDEVTIKSQAGDTTTLRRSGTEWAIVQPAAAAADPAEVSGLTSNLASVQIQRVLDENPVDLTQYGLAAPRVEVSFKSGGQEHRLLLGDKTPSGTDLYAKLADQKKVFTVSSFLDSTFNRGAFDLRDKAVLKLDREKLDSLEIVTPLRTMRFGKLGAEWQMTEPAAGRADSSAIDGLAARLAGAQMKALTEAAATNLKQYGLEPPAATVRLASGSSQGTLIIGGTAGEGSVFARALPRAEVFTIDASLLDDVKKDPSEYRQKDLFDARGFNANRFEITRAGQTTAYEKTRVKNKDGQDEEKWRQVAPEARDVDTARVEALLAAITAARAGSFVDSTANTGLDKPEISVAIRFDGTEARNERVSFARNGADAYAARAGDPGAAKIDPAVIDALVKAFEGMK